MGLKLAAYLAVLVHFAITSSVVADVIDHELELAGVEGHTFVLGPTSLEGGDPTGPGKWGDPNIGTPAHVTYSFIPTGTYLDVGYSNQHLSTFMPFGFENEIRAAFEAWSNAARITFSEVADDGVAFNASPTAGHGDIRIGGAAFDGVGSTLAVGFFPPPNGNTAAGDIFFDAGENWTINSLDGNTSTIDVYQVAAHEIGHAIGLAHTDVPNSLMNPYYSEAFSGPQADDIAGAKYIYSNPEPSSFILLSMTSIVFWIRRRSSSPAASHR